MSVTIQIQYNSLVPTTPQHMEIARLRREELGIEPTVFSSEINIDAENFDPDFEQNFKTICNEVYRATNVYYGEIWNALQPLPEARSHTALSTGDVVIVNGERFWLGSTGFERLAEGQDLPVVDGYVY